MKILNIFLLGAFFSIAVLPSTFACPCNKPVSTEELQRSLEPAVGTVGD